MSTVIELYKTLILLPGKQALLLLLVAFVVTFLFIRLSVRMIRAGVSWWPGNVSAGGTHIHHVVFGTVFMLIGGVLAFAPAGWASPWWEILAALFGVGAALVLDEFALILHLEDVYWAEQGRLSVQAVALGAALTGMLLLGALPLGGDSSTAGSDTGRWGSVVTIVVNGLLVVLALTKGRLWLGVLGVLFPPFAFFGAVRLGRADSLWARWRYPAGSRKAARAHVRTQRHDARWTQIKIRIVDAIGGRPDAPSGEAGDAAQPPEPALAPVPEPATRRSARQEPEDGADSTVAAQQPNAAAARSEDAPTAATTTRSPDTRALLVSVWASAGFAVLSLAWGLALGSGLIVFDGLYSFASVGLSVLGVLALRAARKGPDERYPWGREVWEPLTIVVKAAALGGLCVYALIGAIREILSGGREIAAGWAVLYAVVAIVGGLAVSLYLRRRSGQASDLVRAEAAEWLGDTLLSFGVLGGFLVALLLEVTGHGVLARYVDPTMVAVISAAFLRVPARLLAGGAREVLTMSPAPALQHQLWERVRAIQADYGFAESFLRTSKVGGRLDVEADFVVDATSKAQTVRQFDQVRADLQRRLGPLGYATSMTVSFTADRQWAIATPVIGPTEPAAVEPDRPPRNARPAGQPVEDRGR